MVGLPDGEKQFETQYRRVTDGRTDILRRHSPRYAYASRGKNRGFPIDNHWDLQFSNAEKSPKSEENDPTLSEGH